MWLYGLFILCNIVNEVIGFKEMVVMARDDWRDADPTYIRGGVGDEEYWDDEDDPTEISGVFDLEE